MSTLTPLETLYEVERGSDLPLPPELPKFAGRLQFPPHPGRSYVIANFVTTIDGVAALNAPSQVGGGDISGFNEHDRMLMGLLRAVADAVVVGAGTLRADPMPYRTVEHVYPALAPAYQQLRANLGKAGQLLNVIVTARAEIDLAVFQSGEVPVLIITTGQGMRRIGEQSLPSHIQVVVAQGAGFISARNILEAVNRVQPGDVILVEGGPRLIGDFFAEQALDELFLTLAPQIAGRDETGERPGLVAGRRFAPEHPLWGTLVSVKRGGSHLFLRYAFHSSERR